MIRVGTAIPGIAKYAATLQLPSTMLETLEQRNAELAQADNDHERGKEVLSKAYEDMDLALAAARSHAQIAREVVKRSLGNHYTQSWTALGFNGSLQIPRTVDGMLALLPNLQSYLRSNPSLVVPVLDVTPERTTILLTNLLAAKNVVNELKSDRKRLMNVRKQKEANARRSLRMLAKDLSFALSSVDPRWKEFGFNPPGVLAVPEVPKTVEAVVVAKDAVAVKWSRAPRAKRYRIWKKIIGVDVEFNVCGTSADLDLIIESLPPGAIVEVAVSAVNNGGESGLSEVLRIVTTV